MGESRGGGREAAGLPVIQAVTDLVLKFNEGGRELGRLHIQRTTQGVYSVDVYEHGSEDWETLFIGTADRSPVLPPSPPSGGTGRTGKER